MHNFVDGNHAILRLSTGTVEVAPVMFTSAITSFHKPSSKWSRNSKFDCLRLSPSFSAAYKECNFRTEADATRTTTWCTCGNSAPKPHSVVLDVWRWQLHLPSHYGTMIGRLLPAQYAGDEPGNWCPHGRCPGQPSCTSWLSGRLPVTHSEKGSKVKRGG